MCRGLPASWKTTWAIEEVKKNPHWTIRINNDELRRMMGWDFNKLNESVVTNLRLYWARLALSKWLHVIIDNTNLNPVHEEDCRDIAKHFNAQFKIKDFVIDVEEAIKRDSMRSNPVGEKVIRDMANKYLKKEDSIKKIEMDKSKPSCYIFDIDGTLAQMNGRSPYDYSRVLEDSPRKEVVKILDILKSCGNNIVICSWRPDSCLWDTVKWLYKNHINYNWIRMRKTWDKREDSIVKKEMLDDIVKEYYVEGVFDDRLRVCRMWYNNWLEVFRVGNPDADF